MRALTVRALFAASLLSSAFAKPAAVDTQHQLNVDEALSEPKEHKEASKATEDGPKAGATNSEAISDNSTIFNDLEVPPMKELTGDKLEEDIKNGYWFIKHYSPYCGHCKAVAPTWQTLYEFYYTSKPVPTGNKASQEGDSMNSFSRYYNFNFASIDCIAFGDACAQHDVAAFPTFSVYKDGEFIKKFEEKKDMENLSKFVEDILETIRPGSRPAEGLKLPNPGDTSVEGGSSSESTEKTKPSKAPSVENSKASESSEAADSEATNAKSTKGSSKSDKPKETTKPKKISAPVNPDGHSINLSQEDFQKKVTNTQDPWFIKFYAPWCHHCQALAPSWAQMAKELQGKLNVGEVNCDRESRLCKDVHVSAYPTMHFFRGGERVAYEGLRGLGDLVSYAKKALDVGIGVQYVNETSFKKMEETEEVIFVYFYDHATTSEDFEALERLTLSLIGHAKLVKTDDKALADRFKVSTWPRLLVSRDGRPSYYDALAPKDMRDYRQVLPWMQSVWLPIVPELTASNSREIMRGRYVVLAILSRERADEFVLDKREVKNAALDWMEKQRQAFELERQELRDAKQLRLEEAEDRNDDRGKRAAKSIRIDIREDDKKQVGFAWVDGIFWERWIKTTYGISVKDGERVIINDEDNHRYWDTTISGAYIVPSRTSILETIPKVISSPPKISSKSTTGFIGRIFFGFTGLTSSHPFLMCGLIIGSLIGAWTWGRGKGRGMAMGGGGKRKGGAGWGSGSGGFFHLDGKEGLLNGGGYGKAD